VNFQLVTTKEEEQFREEVSDFLKKELTYELQRQHAMDMGLKKEGREFAKKLGQKKWLGINWPEKYGGAGLPMIYEFILIQELARHEAHIPTEIACFMGGPLILRHGSEAMKEEFVPRIAKGEMEFGLGYSEPQAGSDLMAMQMTAVEDGEYFIINGQKTFNTESHYADYHWLAAKTDSQAPRHKSISLFIVDQRAPGITIRPIETLGGEQSNEVFYDDVMVPKSRVVGEKNKGFLYMVEALNYERLALYQNERLKPVLARLVEYSKTKRRNGKLLAEDSYVRQMLAQMEMEIEVALSLEYRAIAMLLGGDPPDYEAGLVKLFGSELRQRVGYKAMDILGLFGLLEEGSEGEVFRGEVARLCRSGIVDTIGGGTSEIIRNITAMRGLGLGRK